MDIRKEKDQKKIKIKIMKEEDSLGIESREENIEKGKKNKKI